MKIIASWGINMHFIMSLCIHAFHYVTLHIMHDVSKYLYHISSSYHGNKCLLRHMHYISCRFFQLAAYHAWYSLIASTYKWVSASWAQTCVAIVVFSHSGMYIVFFNPYHASHLIWINRLCKREEGNEKGCYILSHLFFSQIIKFTSWKKKRIMGCHAFLGSNV